MHLYAYNLFHSVSMSPYYLTTFTCTPGILFWTPENSQILKNFNFLCAFLVISPCNSLFVHNNYCMESAPYNYLHLTPRIYSTNSYPFSFIGHNSKIFHFPSWFSICFTSFFAFPLPPKHLHTDFNWFTNTLVNLSFCFHSVHARFFCFSLQTHLQMVFLSRKSMWKQHFSDISISLSTFCF